MSAPRTLGEQWHPTPARLTQAIMEAPTAKRRQWAIETRTMWEVVFHKASRGESVKLRELMAWANCTNKDRATKARTDALKCFQLWEKASSTRTELGQASDKNRTEVITSDLGSPVAVGQVSDKTRTLARALPSTDTKYISTEGGGPGPTAAPKAAGSTSSSTSDTSPLPAADPTPTSPSDDPGISGDASQTTPAAWTASALLSCWQSAWSQSGRGCAPSPTTKDQRVWIPKLLSELTGAGHTTEAFTAALTAWLVAQEAGAPRVFPPHGEPPKIGHIKGVYRGYLPTPAGSAAPTGGDADALWQAMSAAMSRVGGRREPTPADAGLTDAEFARAYAALGGRQAWAALCRSRADQLNYTVRPRFVRAIRTQRRAS